jgi:hypothetical protein
MRSNNLHHAPFPGQSWVTTKRDHCCTYSGNVRSCTWRVKMAIESSVFVHLHVIWICCQIDSRSAASTFMMGRNHRRWIGSINSFVSKLSGLCKTAWPTISKVHQNTQSGKHDHVMSGPQYISWFTVVGPRPCSAHSSCSCMYCRLSSKGAPSVNTTVLRVYFVPTRGARIMHSSSAELAAG